NTLVNQDFIKDSKQSVSQYVKSVDSSLEITGFERVALGS
ncbi:MAG: elongation factor Ts, partial [Eudoraea sp.]|nr:elongation factor Ts [Eudoraea sp.]NNJ39418.1 elongation factor Ts [Eudoraea sp.]